MPRPIRCRRVFWEPNVSYFKPAGVPLSVLEEVEITVEEAEALRQIDFSGRDQKEVAEAMNVSQPTLSRILISARKKVAEAVTQGKALKISGGNYRVENLRKMQRSRAGMMR